MDWIAGIVKSLFAGFVSIVLAYIEPHLGMLVAIASGATVSIVMRQKDTGLTSRGGFVAALFAGWYCPAMVLHFFPGLPAEPLAALFAFFGVDVLRAARASVPDAFSGFLRRLSGGGK